jgi:hypothetical protein
MAGLSGASEAVSAVDRLTFDFPGAFCVLRAAFCVLEMARSPPSRSGLLPPSSPRAPVPAKPLPAEGSFRAARTNLRR